MEVKQTADLDLLITTATKDDEDRRYLCICSSICVDTIALYEHQQELNEKQMWTPSYEVDTLMSVYICHSQNFLWHEENDHRLT